MINFSKFIFASLFIILTCDAFAQKEYFNEHPTIWKDADILIWTIDKEPIISPKEFCLSIKRINASIGNPECRLFGEWNRDTIAFLYGTWLNANINSKLKGEYLKARHPAMQAKIQNLEDKIILFVSKKDSKVNIALFDETSLEPKATGSILLSPDIISMGDEIAGMFFKTNTKRRLSKNERNKLKTEPDEYFQEIPLFKGWAGIGIGYSQAQIPLTPKNWYSSHINSTIRNYRITKDSVSLWNFLDDSDPYFTLYFGGTWYDFIGLELTYHFAKHNVKTESKDTIYNELEHWKFSQHEIGLNAMFSRNYSPLNWLNITPFLFLGFQYSFFIEDIKLKDSVKKPSKAYNVRIKFEEAYKGALLGFGSHFILFKHYGLGFRTGISSRGRDMYVDPSPDAASEPSVIGGSTIDWFIGVGLEYHITIF